VKARILLVPPDRLPLYAEWLTEILADIHSEHTPQAHWLGRVRDELRKNANDPACLCLVAELVDPTAEASRTAPPGYVEASTLLAIPDADPLLGPLGSVLRALYTVPNYRQRGLATSLLKKAEEILAQRRVAGIRADVFYGDDAIVGLFERREYMRGRMGLHRSFVGDQQGSAGN
jgi:ribosomal protein S18 acetylase RimI-like enzyme